MKDLNKYTGIIPAFYACYDDKGDINPQAVQALTKHFIDKGVKGLYVGGSSGECIYQNPAERKLVLENVMQVAKGRITVIAHVACNNTRDSRDLAQHAESLGVDAIASIPPIYFHLPENAITEYWNDISSAAPNTDFIIYNIPQLAGTSLSIPMLKEMLKNPRVVGVKNSSMPVQDIQLFKAAIGDNGVVFNGPDEQLVAGLATGADGGIGGTYGAMPELYVEMFNLFKAGNIDKAREMQNDVCEIIYKLCSCSGNMYGVIKEVLRQRVGIDCGSVRKPFKGISEQDLPTIAQCIDMINVAMVKYCA